MAGGIGLETLECQRLYVEGERKTVLTGMRHYKRIPAEALSRGVHETCQFGSGRALNLDAHAAGSTQDQQIELGARVCSPEEALLRTSAQMGHDFLQHKTLPRCADLRMRIELIPRCDTEQRV